MPSRHAYTALTPDYADFAIPHSTSAVISSASNALLRSNPELDGGARVGRHPSRWRAAVSAVRRTVKNNVGLLLVAAAQAFFSLMNVAVKKLNSIDPPVSTLELVAVRMAITYVCCLVYMFSAKVPDPFLGPKGVRLLLVFRGFSGFFGLFGIYYSLEYLSLSDATVLTFLAPLCTGIAGAIFLGESFTRKEALASFFSLLGVVLIARPVFLFGKAGRVAGEQVSVGAGGGGGGEGYPEIGGSEKGTPSERLVAVGVAMLGVLGSTGAYTSIRAIGKRAHPLHAMMSFSTQCIIVTTIGMLVLRTPFIVPTQLDWVALLVMIGIFGFIAQVLLTMGLQRETAGRGSMAVYTQVVFATVLERIFFKSSPSVLSVIGTLIIITSALYVALTKEQTTTSKSDMVRLDDMHEGALEEGLLERAREDEERKGPLPLEPLHTPRQDSSSHSSPTIASQGDSGSGSDTDVEEEGEGGGGGGYRRVSLDDLKTVNS